MLEFPSLLNAADRELLRAVTSPREEALPAYRRWRAMVALDDVQSAIGLAIPRLVDLATNGAADDPDIGRMKGMARHVWTLNTVKLRVLFAAIKALDAAGIPVLLLKGAAIFARDTAMTAQRIAGDYDILVAPDDIARACQTLAAAGFRPKIMTWTDIQSDAIDSVTAGAALELAGALGDLDLHWRPLPNIFDGSLTARLFECAERSKLLGQDVLLPSATHHLFLAIARCEPWDSNECLSRLLEGHVLLSRMANEVDWAEMLSLVRRYRLQMVAGAYLQTQRVHGALALPPQADRLGQLDRAAREVAEKMWAIQSLPPARRNPLQLRVLALHDGERRQSPVTVGAPGLMESVLQYVGASSVTLRLIWRLVARRLCGATARRLFLSGFSYPELAGRWTEGHWSLLVIPLDPTQPREQKVKITVTPFAGQHTVYVHGGCGLVVWRPRNRKQAELMIRCRSLPRLGGAALVLLSVPGAVSPAHLGVSNDRRKLGVLIHR